VSATPAAGLLERSTEGWRAKRAGALGVLRYLWRRNPLACVLVTLFVLSASVGASVVSHNSVYTVNLTSTLARPSLSHILGTDAYGRDILARVIVSCRVAVLAFVLVVGIAGITGTTLGALAGERGGLPDLVASRLIELVQGFPFVLLALGLVAILGPSEVHALIAIGIATIPDFFRIARSSAVELRDREFVLAARSVGVKRWRLFYSEILPNMAGSLVIVATFDGAQAIIAEATLSFLGLGAQPPQPSFGTMISDAEFYMVEDPLYLVMVAVCLALVVIGLNMLGDSLSDFFSEYAS
jgi:peptide/nickel transport system permease protein